MHMPGVMVQKRLLLGLTVRFFKANSQESKRITHILHMLRWKKRHTFGHNVYFYNIIMMKRVFLHQLSTPEIRLMLILPFRLYMLVQ